MPSKTATWPSSSFSPIAAAVCSIAWSTVRPSDSVACASASTSAGLAAGRERDDVGREGLELLVLRDEVGLAVERDHRALGRRDQAVARRRAREPRLATLAPCLTRRISTALSKSPSASSRARLQSIIPAPVSVAELLHVSSADSHLVSFSYSVVGSMEQPPAQQPQVRQPPAQQPQVRQPPAQQPQVPTASGAAAPRTAGVRGRGLSPSSSSRSQSASGSSVPSAPGSGFSSPAAAAGAGDQALGDRVGDHAGQRRDRADRVVVARDRVVDEVRVAVAVEDRDDRDLQLARLGDGDVLLVGVDDPHRARELAPCRGCRRACGRASRARATSSGLPSWW